MQKSGVRNPWGTKLVREAKKLVPTGSQSRSVGSEGYKLVCGGTPGEMVAGRGTQSQKLVLTGPKS